MAHRYFLRVRRFLRDRSGQDMVEYALLAGFLAVSAGATLPNISGDLDEIFGNVKSVTAAAAGQQDKSRPHHHGDGSYH